jgi:hypothetical protein
MAPLDLDPSQPVPDKLRVEAPDAPALPNGELKARIAEKVRGDSRERNGLTTEEELLGVTPELEIDEVRALLTDMASGAAYGDIKALVAPAGRVYLFSEKYLAPETALEKGQVEEAKVAIVERIRADSRSVALTSIADLEALFPFPEPERRTALLDEIRADPRYEDIQAVSGPGGELYLHSDRHLSGNYGAIMMRARAKNPCWAIAELVRDRSRVMPAPTQLTVFREAVFDIPPEALDATLEELLGKAEFADIQKLVHPKTRAVYLYSDRFLDAARAFEIMDWDEVGVFRNP